MRNYMKEILPAFIAGETMETKTASCENHVFFSYNTRIAIFDKISKTIILESRKFSKTTSSQQNAIKDFAAENKIPLIENPLYIYE